MSSRRRSIPTQDRISDLPDSLICHILSFLPTKLAITTSVLSKRWNPLWRSVFSLHLDENTSRNIFTFHRFVNSVFDSRDDTLPLLSFRIKCVFCQDLYSDDINRFVQAALQRGIQNFNLNLSFPIPTIPCSQLTPSVFSVLTCSTLVVLKLKNLTIYNVPQLVDLPSLKTLNLVRVFFMADYVDFKRLLNGCPILENLKTNRLHPPYFPQISEIEIKAFPKLVTANLSNCTQNFTFTWLHNAKFLRAQLLETYINQVPTFLNLTYMELIFITDSWPHKWKWVIQVLQHCPKLQNLIIEEASHDIPLPEDKDWEDPKTVPECLSSQLTTCLLRGSINIGCELQFAEYIILNSKQLRTMTIKSTCLDNKAKHQMHMRLSSYPRVSSTCTLLVD